MGSVVLKIHLDNFDLSGFLIPGWLAEVPVVGAAVVTFAAYIPSLACCYCCYRCCCGGSGSRQSLKHD